MNDLETLRTVLAVDEPPRDVVDRSRHRLLNHMHGGSPSRRRTTRLVIGAGVTAAAAAAAVVIVTTPSTPAGNPPARPSDVQVEVTGQEILLAAATAAERSPDGSGTYWYYKVTTPSDAYEYWVKPNGEVWFRGKKTHGEVKQIFGAKPKPFSLVGAADLTLDEIRAMPTDPDALKAWIAKALEHTTARTSAGPYTEQDKKRATFFSLISLVSTLPAPPAVRAAAFRAIAAYPGVQNLGAVPGGQGLLLPQWPTSDGRGVRFVVDPSTGRVNGTSAYVDMDGALAGTDNPAGYKITARWTDTLTG